MSDMSMFHLRRAALLILGAGSLITGATAAPQTQRTGAPAKAVVTYGLDNPEVLRGYQAVLAAIGLVPATSGDRAQYEAQIAYALDQAQLDCLTTLAALDLALRHPGMPRATYGALRTVTKNASLCSGNGIAAQDAGPAGFLLSAGPATGLGGGSSNYSGG